MKYKYCIMMKNWKTKKSGQPGSNLSSYFDKKSKPNSHFQNLFGNVSGRKKNAVKVTDRWCKMCPSTLTSELDLPQASMVRL